VVDLEKTTKWKFIDLSHHFYGLVSFQDALEIQKKVWEQVRSQNGSLGMVLGFEHPQVITAGRSLSKQKLSKLPNPGANLITSPSDPIIMTDRGGFFTAHNPGQLVIYPILPLRNWGISVREFLNILIHTTENFLKENLVEPDMRVGELGMGDSFQTGVFVGGAKIMSMGVRIENGVSRHGISINICNDLSVFDGFSVCGQTNASMTNLKNCLRISNEESSALDLQKLFLSWMRQLRFQLNHVRK
jgi:lipoyl(octanoyl) transferase